MKREKIIKVRVSDDEYVNLSKRKTQQRLASWMREYCLDAAPALKNEPIKCDPDLLRQLAGVGNNLNQIARRLNSKAFTPGDKQSMLMHLVGIERVLKDLYDQHCS